MSGQKSEDETNVTEQMEDENPHDEKIWWNDVVFWLVYRVQEVGIWKKLVNSG